MEMENDRGVQRRNIKDILRNLSHQNMLKKLFSCIQLCLELYRKRNRHITVNTNYLNQERTYETGILVDKS